MIRVTNIIFEIAREAWNICQRSSLEGRWMMETMHILILILVLRSTNLLTWRAHLVNVSFQSMEQIMRLKESPFKTWAPIASRLHKFKMLSDIQVKINYIIKSIKVPIWPSLSLMSRCANIRRIVTSHLDLFKKKGTKTMDIDWLIGTLSDMPKTENDPFKV